VQLARRQDRLEMELADTVRAVPGSRQRMRNLLACRGTRCRLYDEPMGRVIEPGSALPTRPSRFRMRWREPGTARTVSAVHFQPILAPRELHMPESNATGRCPKPRGGPAVLRLRDVES